MVLTGLLTACGSGGTSDASPPARSSAAAPAASLPEVPGFAAEAVQLRTDAAIGGQVQVRITDTGSAPFTVTSVQLVSPGFAPLPAKPVTAEYAPGRTIDLTTRFGPVDCAVAVDRVGARLIVLRPDGTTEELLVPLAGDTMARVHEATCAVEEVLAVVGVAVEDLTDAGETMTAEVVLRRRSGNEAVQVSRLTGSVVLDVQSDDDLPVALPAGEAELRIPVTVDPARCDPHALAEAKQPFLLTLAVTVGDGDSVPVPLPLDGAQRDRLLAMLGRVCVG
jgi:hypothetical protein